MFCDHFSISNFRRSEKHCFVIYCTYCFKEAYFILLIPNVLVVKRSKKTVKSTEKVEFETAKLESAKVVEIVLYEMTRNASRRSHKYHKRFDVSNTYIP